MTLKKMMSGMRGFWKVRRCGYFELLPTLWRVVISIKSANFLLSSLVYRFRVLEKLCAMRSYIGVLYELIAAIDVSFSLC